MMVALEAVLAAPMAVLVTRLVEVAVPAMLLLPKSRLKRLSHLMEATLLSVHLLALVALTNVASAASVAAPSMRD